MHTSNLSVPLTASSFACPRQGDFWSAHFIPALRHDHFCQSTHTGPDWRLWEVLHPVLGSRRGSLRAVKKSEKRWHRTGIKDSWMIDAQLLTQCTWDTTDILTWNKIRFRFVEKSSQVKATALCLSFIGLSVLTKKMEDMQHVKLNFLLIVMKKN